MIVKIGGDVLRESILIVSTNTHSFLYNEVKYASEVFTNVFVVAPRNSEFERYVDTLPNVKLYSIQKKDLIANAVLSLPLMVNKESIKELIDARKRRLLSKDYFRAFTYFWAFSESVRRIVVDKIGLNVDGAKEWVLYSAWYYAPAFAVANLKRSLLTYSW